MDFSEEIIKLVKLNYWKIIINIKGIYFIRIDYKYKIVDSESGFFLKSKKICNKFSKILNTLKI